MSIAANIAHIQSSLPVGTRLVAVSKYQPVEAIRQAYNAGQRLFGESRAQELKAKQEQLPADIEWHFIGSLQSNKVKDIIPFVHTIHSIDSLKLLDEVHRQAEKQQRTVDVLLEIHLAQEVEKHGFAPDECRTLLESLSLSAYPFIRITGLMCMASATDDSAQIRQEFHALHSLFGEFKQQRFADVNSFCELSMGMSHDYAIALTEGSTMVRIGTGIFGNRQ